VVGRPANELVAGLRGMCRSARAQADVPVMVVEGLLPPGEGLLDVQVSRTEFDEGSPQPRVHDTEERRRRGSKQQKQRTPDQPWNSLLRGEVLHALEDDCPGALESMRSLRQACSGFFLAD
jgi:hypothetical protein